MNSLKLVEVVVSDDHLADEARWAVYGAWDVVDIAKEEAEHLRQQVIDGVVSVGALRAGVVWANALDKEAVEIYGADLTQGEQQVERTARRILHLAGRSALEGVKNSRKRLIARVSCNQLRNLVQ